MSARYIREAVVTYRKTEVKVREQKITGSREAAVVLRQIIEDGPQERVVVLGLSARHKVIGWHLASAGGLAGTHVEPGSIFRWALITGVHAIIIAHNHPSGDCLPSTEDTTLTERVVEAGKLLGINVLDHIILGDGCHFSYTDEGILP